MAVTPSFLGVVKGNIIAVEGSWGHISVSIMSIKRFNYPPSI